MTYGPPPSDPNGPAPWPGPAQQGYVPPGQPPQGYVQQGQYPYPQQPWNVPAAPGWPGTFPATPPKGLWPGAVAVVSAVLGALLPLLPVNESGVRSYIALPFGLVGLALAIVGCVGYRRGKPLAVTGVVLSALVTLFGLAILVNTAMY